MSIPNATVPISEQTNFEQKEMRFILDTDKIKTYFAEQGIDETEMKNQLYSHKQTKPTLKFKIIK